LELQKTVLDLLCNLKNKNKLIMKKRILVLAAIFGASASFAQVTSLKNKKGFEILPEAGDYAIQFDATPMLDFAVNAVKMGANGTQTAGNTATWVTGFTNTFVGKYFKDASTAYRVKVGINATSNSNDVVLGTYGTNNEEYIRTDKTKVTNIILGGGIEKRRGHNRLQGFYGGELLIMIGSPTATTSSEYSLDFQQAITEGVETAGTTRSLGVTKSSAFGVMARGFVGVEYFVLPKISLGAEFGWGLGFNSSSAEVTTELDNAGTTEEIVSTASNTGGLNIGNTVSGNVVATFHF
jgi:hypothetical protein